MSAPTKNFEEQDIIDDVTSETTPWLGQLVTVSKSDSKIHFCIDMRNANAAIERTRFLTPTVDDLFFSVEKRSVFYKNRFKCSFTL